MTEIQKRDTFRILRFSGDENASFLQGQLTQDVRRLGDEPALLAASCDARGKVIAVLTLIACPDGSGDILVAVRDALSDSWLEQVMRFRLRAKVDAKHDDSLTITTASQAATGGALAHWQLSGSNEALVRTTTHTAATALREQRLRAGIVDIAAHASVSYTPHMLSLNRVDAISFRKGCYTGQEVVARTEHLGRAKRTLQVFESTTVHTDDEPASLMQGDKPASAIVATADQTIGAIMSLDAAQQTLTDADGQPVRWLGVREETD
ncbi:MAG: hypothetical protein AAGA84_04355 [Pseudomonadota bacterium]